MGIRVYDCKCITHYPATGMGWVTCIFERRFIADSAEQAEAWAEAEARAVCRNDGRIVCECYDMG